MRGYRLNSGTDAEWVARQLCRLLEMNGFRRIVLRAKKAEEPFFALGDRTFEDARELLRKCGSCLRGGWQPAQATNARARPQVGGTRPPDRQEQETNEVHEAPHPWRQQPSATSAVPAAGRHWVYAIIVICLVVALIGASLGLGPSSANLPERQSPPAPIARQDGEFLVGPKRHSRCVLVKLSETLIDVSCAGSWARMRWAEQCSTGIQ